LEALWGGAESLIVVSSDLSHFHDYETAQRLDSETSGTIEALRDGELSGERACGYRALAGLLRRAAHLDLRATTLDLRNSGDTAGDRQRVVGYGAYAFEPADQARLPERFRAQLLEVARRAIAFGAETGRRPSLDADAYPAPLRARRCSFVTVKVGGRLRGCVGSLAPDNELVADVARNAFKAAFRDTRFEALSPADLSETQVGISILSRPRPMTFRSEADLIDQLRPNQDGLIIEDNGRRGVFLPQVWRSIPSPDEFLGHLKTKAGLPAEHWSASLKAWRYSTESFGEAD
jgi:AmmeMemoRadiSam system protein A